MKTYPLIGIRPVVDARLLGIREALEEKTRIMAEQAQRLIESTLHYADGTPARCIIFSGSIGGGEEAARCEEEFSSQSVCATLTVTPRSRISCLCHGCLWTDGASLLLHLWKGRPDHGGQYHSP